MDSVVVLQSYKDESSMIMMEENTLKDQTQKYQNISITSTGSTPPKEEGGSVLKATSTIAPSHGRRAAFNLENITTR